MKATASVSSQIILKNQEGLIAEQQKILNIINALLWNDGMVPIIKLPRPIQNGLPQRDFLHTTGQENYGVENYIAVLHNSAVNMKNETNP